MPLKKPPEADPLTDNPQFHSDAHPGAVLLSDQIEFYIREPNTLLLTNPDDGRISDDELGKCLDAASYKLRLGNEANVGGRRVAISDDQPLVLPPHQVAVVKTHEEVNIPRFLIARWNLRVKWVYEGLLWVGGPQVDPGWQGALYCPIYNLAEREVVIPYMERVFTMDFTRTTPFHKEKASYGYKSKPHQPARQKDLQGHDVNRLQSAPFSALSQLATLDTRVTAFSSLTFLALAVIIAAIGVIAALNDGAAAMSKEVTGNKGLFVLTAVAFVFGFSGLVISSIAMATQFRQPPRGRVKLTLLALSGTILLGFGAGGAGLLVTSWATDWSSEIQYSLVVATAALIIVGMVFVFLVWLRATHSDPVKADLRLSLRPFGLGFNSRGFWAGRLENFEDGSV